MLSGKLVSGSIFGSYGELELFLEIKENCSLNIDS